MPPGNPPASTRVWKLWCRSLSPRAKKSVWIRASANTRAGKVRQGSDVLAARRAKKRQVRGGDGSSLHLYMPPVVLLGRGRPRPSSRPSHLLEVVEGPEVAFRSGIE